MEREDKKASRQREDTEAEKAEKRAERRHPVQGEGDPVEHDAVMDAGEPEPGPDGRVACPERSGEVHAQGNEGRERQGPEPEGRKGEGREGPGGGAGAPRVHPRPPPCARERHGLRPQSVATPLLRDPAPASGSPRGAGVRCPDPPEPHGRGHRFEQVNPDGIAGCRLTCREKHCVRTRLQAACVFGRPRHIGESFGASGTGIRGGGRMWSI